MSPTSCKKHSSVHKQVNDFIKRQICDIGTFDKTIMQWILNKINTSDDIVLVELKFAVNKDRAYLPLNDGRYALLLFDFLVPIMLFMSFQLVYLFHLTSRKNKA